MLTHPVAMVALVTAIVVVVTVAFVFAVVATTNLTPPENRKMALKVLRDLLVRFFGRGGGGPPPGD